MTSKTRSVVTILWIGLFAWTVDITDNLIFNQLRGITPKMGVSIHRQRIDWYTGFPGWSAICRTGCGNPLTIALTWTDVFYAASRKLMVLTRRPVVSGLVYGGAIYLFMNFIVLPLSGVPHPRSAFSIASRINGVLALLFFIGLPISLLIRRYAGECHD
jgi:hypothetical protein